MINSSLIVNWASASTYNRLQDLQLFLYRQPFPEPEHQSNRWNRQDKDDEFGHPQEQHIFW